MSLTTGRVLTDTTPLGNWIIHLIQLGNFYPFHSLLESDQMLIW